MSRGWPPFCGTDLLAQSGGPGEAAGHRVHRQGSGRRRSRATAGRELAGDDRRAGAGTVLQNLEQIAAPVLREGAECPVVEHEDVDAGEAGEEADVAPVGVGEGELLVEPGD